MTFCPEMDTSIQKGRIVNSNGRWENLTFLLLEPACSTLWESFSNERVEGRRGGGGIK